MPVWDEAEKEFKHKRRQSIWDEAETDYKSSKSAPKSKYTTSMFEDNAKVKLKRVIKGKPVSVLSSVSDAIQELEDNKVIIQRLNDMLEDIG